MHIRVNTDGGLVLLQPDDFKRFQIEVADGDLGRDALVAALASIATPDGNDFWIDVAGLKALSGRDADPGWAKGFQSMLGAAQRFGWLSPDVQK